MMARGFVDLLFILLCGAIGFFAALWFNLQIYAAIKVD